MRRSGLRLANCVSISMKQVNQLLMGAALAGLFASSAVCQETTDGGGSPLAVKTRSPFIARFLKDKNPEDLTPFTPQERLRYYLARSAGPGSTFSAAAAAGFQQLTNKPAEWNQGSEGYRKRFASAYGAHIVQGTIEYGASALLHEDNRYRPSLEAGWWRRSKHAIIGALSSTDDTGRRHFSYSRVGAAGATAFVRRTWQPASTGGVSDAFGGFALTLTAQMGTNLFKEFRSDLRKLFLKRR